KKRKSRQLECETLEERKVPNNLLAVGQGMFLGSTLMAQVAAPVRTPTQILLRGHWGDGQAGAPSRDPLQDPRSSAIPPRQADTFFSDASVAGRQLRDQDEDSRRQGTARESRRQEEQAKESKEDRRQVFASPVDEPLADRD